MHSQLVLLIIISCDLAVYRLTADSDALLGAIEISSFHDLLFLWPKVPLIPQEQKKLSGDYYYYY